MPVPSSGQLTLSGIRSVGVSGGCTEAGQAYSLSALANNFGIGTNPDKMSDFYGLSCPGGSCTSAFYGVGYTDTEVCCSPVITQLFYNNGAISPGDAGNPLKLTSCTGTLFTGYIDSGPYPVTNGIINYTPIACPECPASCECFEIGGSSLLIYADWTDCCGNEYLNDPIQNGAKLCIQLDRSGNPRIQFASDGFYSALGTTCVCGQSCGR